MHNYKEKKRCLERHNTGVWVWESEKDYSLLENIFKKYILSMRIKIMTLWKGTIYNQVWVLAFPENHTSLSSQSNHRILKSFVTIIFKVLLKNLNCLRDT